jgi:AP-3 complex subunit sigma
VCEYDLIFNFETLHATLAEIIVGGVVIETSLEKIVEGVKLQGKVPKRPSQDTGGVGTVGRFGGLAGFGRGEGVWPGR